MRSKTTFFVLLSFVFCCPALFGQGRRGGEAQDQKPPATDKVTPEIPGVVKAGTKIEVVKFGLRGADAGVGGCLSFGVNRHGDMVVRGDANHQ